MRGLSLSVLLKTGRHLSANHALALLDQAIFNILVANGDAHAKSYSVLLPLGAKSQLAPLYDVSSALSWPHVVQSYAQKIAEKKRWPCAIAGRHWEAIAAEIGYGPANVKKRVQHLVDRIVANRVKVAGDVCELAGPGVGYVQQTAENVEINALRMAGRL